MKTTSFPEGYPRTDEFTATMNGAADTINGLCDLIEAYEGSLGITVNGDTAAITPEFIGKFVNDRVLLLQNWLDWYEAQASKPPGLIELVLQTRKLVNLPEG